MMASLEMISGSQGNGSPLTSLAAFERIPEFKDEISDSLKCPLPTCGKVILQAKQTNCGHRVCGSCVEKAFDSGAETVPCPLANIPPHGSEECGVGWIKKDIFPDNYARKQVMKLKVYCYNSQYGCKDTPTLQEFPAHLAECSFKPVPCSFESRGCKELLAATDRQQHEDRCPHRTIQCPDCHQELEATSLDDHVQLCPKKRVPCPDCEQLYCSGKKDKHQQRECTRRVGACVYGCPFEGKSVKAMENHYNDAAALRLHLSSVSRRLWDTEDQAEEARNEVAELKNDLAKLNLQCAENKGDIRRVQLLAAANCDDITALKDYQNQCLSKEAFDLDKMNTQRTFRSLTERIERMQDSTGVGSSDVQSMVMQHDRTLILHDVRLAEFDQKLQSLDVCSYDGTLVWKIRDYRRKKLDAVHGRTLSIYSPPFYTNRFGYKSCARIYLNGDGTGKGHHVSLFFVVMKGEYDALLPWPFKQKVTLMLLDQTQAKKHMSDTFRPDPNSSSFQRPVTEMNIASGCPQFVSHELLEKDQTYLKDDTIFIRIKVDLEGLS